MERPETKAGYIVRAKALLREDMRAQSWEEKVRGMERMNSFSSKARDSMRKALASKGCFDLVSAHRHSSRHRREVEASEVCGCFYCLSLFPPSEIVEWVDEEDTAVCPKCPVDAVIGSASGLPIARDFLELMHDRWF